MAETEGKPQVSDRIHWQPLDEEAAPRSRPRLHRGRSASSLSIHSIHSSSLPIPIEYRTLSIDIDDYQRKEALAKKSKTAAASELADLDWHKISVQELTLRLSTSLTDGLSREQVLRKREEYGRNAPPPSETHRIKKIFGYFFKGFGSILLVGSILVFISWQPLGEPPSQANLALAIVLLAVFFIQAAFNLWQDYSSSQVMASIKTMLPDGCRLLRDGIQVTAHAEEIVPGDVILIKAGNKLPADVRFVQVSGDAKFDRSILTGESVPISTIVDSSDDNYLETKCIGLQGTHCVSGTCLGVVVATGPRTVFGRIAKLTNEPKQGLTTLEREVLNFVYIICSIMFTMIIVVIILWAAWLRKAYPDWINVPTLIVDCVSVAVAFIPEGLPIALTASLTISANMMRKNKILCKSLKTVETLGAVSVICSDKTGTLTANKMVVTDCAVGTTKMTAETARDIIIADYNTEGEHASNAVGQLWTVAGLCNSGEFDATTRNAPLAERKIHGDATDQAILRFAESLGPVSDLKRYWQSKFELAFNSKNKFMIRVLGLANPEGLKEAMPTSTAAIFEPGDMLLTIKGAPEILIERCDHYIGDSGVAHQFSATARERLETLKNEWSAQGRRVLLLARKVISRSTLKSSPLSSQFESEMFEHAKSGLTLVGLVAIVDPPRPEIPDVIKTLREAGIRIFMVTGDFALTAQAIATECGIITNPRAAIADISALSRTPKEGNKNGPLNEDATEGPTIPSSIILSGADMLSLNVAQWDQLVTSFTEVVFARTTPENKLRIVRELQARRHIVGMTGDGVNDAPALRAADIGIAVGSGSDIAIEAADMVLLDSFSSVVEAVRYGRMMFDNLKKTIAYLLPAGSFSEFWPVFTNVAFGVPQVLSSFLMIIICCFTDCLAATSLAYETPESDVLSRPPRKIGTDRLVDWKLIVQSYGFIGIIETTCSFAMSYWYLERAGIPFSTQWFSFGNLPGNIDPNYYTQQLYVASSVYFVTLVVMQWFNLLGVRTRRLSIFQHPPLFNKNTRNLYLFPAILFAVAMAFFWLYIPVLQNTLGTAQVPVEHWFLPMTFGLGVLLLEETRKYCVRQWPGGLFARCAW